MKMVQVGTAALISLLWACDAPDHMTRSGTSNVGRKAEALRAVHRANLKYLGTYIEQRNTGFTNREALVAGTVDFYASRFGRESVTFRSVAAAATRETSRHSAARFDVESLPLTSPVRSVVDNVAVLVRTSSSYEQFRSSLDGLEAAVLAEGWSDSDKQTALSYLVLLGETMDFAIEHRADLGAASGSQQVRFALTAGTGEEFDSWWKCAAGVAGGAILGGLTGAAAGSVLPVLGTTAGGIIGAVGGALAGAGSSC